MNTLYWIGVWFFSTIGGMVIMSLLAARRTANLEAKVVGYRAESAGLRAALKAMEGQRDGARLGHKAALVQCTHWHDEYEKVAAFVNKRAAEKGKGKP